MTNTTASVTYTSKLLGKVTLHSYVDPCPGKKGTDKVASECPRCINRSGYIRAFAHVMNGVCFKCQGVGTVPVSVSTVRKHVKDDAFRAEYAEQIAAHRAAFIAEQAALTKAAEFAAAYDEAVAENARRDAMVQGFLGEVGDKVEGLVGTVQVAKYLSGSYNRSARMFLVINLDSGQVVKICASSNSLFDLDRGDKVSLKGEIKGFDSYNGQDQTELFKVKATKVGE